MGVFINGRDLYVVIDALIDAVAESDWERGDSTPEEFADVLAAIMNGRP